MSRVLVLNATYEPLSVVSSRRAVVLVLDNKAILEAATSRVFRSERLTVSEPSVVRLSRYVRVPSTHRRSLSRRALFARDEFACQYCGARADSLDHVVPRSRGGEHTWENVVAACRRCNANKRDRLLGETSMRLRKLPAPPRPSVWFRAAAGRLPEEWIPFLEMAEQRSA
ncbi:MAG: HNH endonuclease [Acidimicrobiales bacterium]